METWSGSPLFPEGAKRSLVVVVMFDNTVKTSRYEWAQCLRRQSTGGAPVTIHALNVLFHHETGAFVDTKKIMIVDEDGFGRVCCALLEMYGYCSEHLSHCEDFRIRCRSGQYGLVITSYPYGSEILNDLKNSELKTIILSDFISSDLLACIKGISQVICLTKPLDFGNFRDVITKMMVCKDSVN